MKTECIIFDWAGTTVDYGCFAPVKAFIEAFKKFGIEPTVDEVRAPMGMLKHNHIETMMKGERISKLWEEVHNRKWTDADVDAVYEESEKGIMEILKNYAEPKPYVIETVAKIREMGIKIGSTTGYTAEMMDIVSPKAEELGYAPDVYFSPSDTENYGRPYPYMVFKNMEHLKVSSVKSVIKVGDTISDIKEGVNAGVTTVGIIEGSSLMALSQEEFNALSSEEQNKLCYEVTKKFKNAGADYVVRDIRGVLDIIEK